MPGLVKEASAESSVARKALSIGIQYRSEYAAKDQPRELVSTHGDPEVVKKILTGKHCIFLILGVTRKLIRTAEYYGYKQEDIVIMKDDGVHPLPTRENIVSFRAKFCP